MSYLDRLFKIEGKVVVITGASGQLGTALCESFEQAGSVAILIDKCPVPAGYTGKPYYQLDVTDQNATRKVFELIAKRYGRIDVLINNAGISTFKPFTRRTEKEFDSIVAVNLKGVFWCIQAYVRCFDRWKMRGGSIVNIGSIFGCVSPDFRNYTDCSRNSPEVYGATKAGVIQMSKYFAVHLAERGIRVNTVSPGGILNEKNPQGKDFRKNYAFRCPAKRMAYAKEVVGAVLYLASDAASYTTGQNLVVDGGLTAW